jgi:hypothetical protein
VKSFKTFAIWTIFGEILQCGWLYYFIRSSNGLIYGTNDDAIISSIASGQLTGTPDPHWIFIQPIISVPLSWIQNFTGNYNLYSIFLLISITLSFSVILGIISINASNKKTIINFILWSLSALTFVTWFSISPTYTTASIFTVSVSLSSLIYAISSKDKSFIQLNRILFTIFIILSYLIRIESIYILIILSFPIVLFNFYENREIKRFKVLLTPIGIALFVFVLNSQLVKIVYSGDEWQQYLSTNSVRHKIQLRGPERILESNYQNFGWDKSTFLQFKNFELADPLEMNSVKLGKIYTENSSNTFSSLVSTFNTIGYMEAMKYAFLNFTWIVNLLLFQMLVSILILFNWKSYLKYFLFLTLFGTSISFIIYILSNNYHVPERISFSILGLWSLVLLAFFNSIDASPANFRFKHLVSILIFSSLFSYPYLTRFSTELAARQNMYEDRNELAENQSLVLGSLDSNAVVISGASSLRFDWINPYSKFESIDPKNRTLILGWYNLSPVWNQKVNDLGLNSSNIYENLTDNNVYWASKTESEEDNQVFWISKYGNNTQVTKISEIGNSEYGLYKITKSN